jgi:hypothetical protein
MFDYSGRLYTFGCSMTSYSYPTWADILGKEFSYYENWGRPGAGNSYIFNSIIECLQRNSISNNDTLIIMWSGIARIDSYQFNEWSHVVGEFVNQKNPNKLLSCPDGYEIISYAYFNAAQQLLELKKLNYYFLSFLDYDKNTRAGELYKPTLDIIRKANFKFNNKKIKRVNNNNLIDLYNRLAGDSWPTLDNILDDNFKILDNNINREITEFKEIITKNRHLYTVTESIIDSHPTPAQHLNMLLDMFPEINISSNTISYINDIDYKYKNSINFNFKKSTPIERL